MGVFAAPSDFDPLRRVGTGSGADPLAPPGGVDAGMEGSLRCAGLCCLDDRRRIFIRWRARGGTTTRHLARTAGERGEAPTASPVEGGDASPGNRTVQIKFLSMPASVQVTPKATEAPTPSANSPIFHLDKERADSIKYRHE